MLLNMPPSTTLSPRSSYDRHRKKFVLWRFHVEGFSIDTASRADRRRQRTCIVSEGIENIPEGWRARETCKIVSQDEYTEVFELAPPQKEFAVYSLEPLETREVTFRVQSCQRHAVTMQAALLPKRNTNPIWETEPNMPRLALLP